MLACGGTDAITPPPESRLPPPVKLAYTDMSGLLFVFNTGTNTKQSIGDGANELAWSPNGSELAVARVVQKSQLLYVWRAVTGQLVELDSIPLPTLCDNRGCYAYPHYFEPAWSPDSRELAYLVGSEIRVANADGMSRRTISLPSGTDARGLRWTPDGRFLTYVDMSSEQSARELRGVAAATGGAPIVMLTTDNYIGMYAWAPDSKKVAVTTEIDISVWENGARLGSTALPVNSPTWSPDGSRIAVFGSSSAEGIYTVNDRSDGLRPVTYDGESGSGLTWTSDGKMLAFSTMEGFFFADPEGGATYKLLGPIGVFAMTAP